MKETTFLHRCLEINNAYVPVVDSFQSLAKKEGFKMLLVLHPCCWELIHPSDRSESIKLILEQLTDSLKANPAINIWDAMEKVINKHDGVAYGFKHDGHCSSAGYKLMAQSICEELDKSYPSFWNSDDDIKIRESE